jgi:uncharacterized Ntn-hydrolase superfamily protein
MTFSIVARGTAGAESQFGVAVASKFLAVGAAVPAAESGVGAIATQALANLRYRPDGLRLLRAGNPAAQALAELTADDEQRADRQAGVVGADGAGATYTGSGCYAWAGGRAGISDAGDGYAIQGNILTGPEVVDAMEAAFLATSTADPLAARLLAALAAGDEAGGDRRGRQSAALLVVSPGGGYGGGSDVLVDLRVDDHPDPVLELDRLLRLHDLYFGHTDPADCAPLEGRLADEVRGLLASVGFAEPDLDAALVAWAGVENLEERLIRGRIDPQVLDYLRAQCMDRSRTAQSRS